MKLQSIQFLRALAALLVVYAHSIDLQMKYSHSAQQDFFYLQNFGAIGVDIFFVISGFIIHFVAHDLNGGRQGLNFLAKRFIRVNPLYYIATLLYFLPFVYHAMQQGNGFPIPPTENILKTFLILPLTDRSQWVSPILSIGWTLSFEWWFYILYFLLIVAGLRNKAGWLVLLLVGLVLAGRLWEPHDYLLISLTNPILLEFLAGTLICWIYLNWKPGMNLAPGRKLAICLILLGAGALIYEIRYVNVDVFLENATIDGGGTIRRFFAWGIPSAFLVAGCVFLERWHLKGMLWNNGWVRLTGDASYSIYLAHYSVFLLFDHVYARRGFFKYPDLGIILQVLAALIGGTLFYRFIERPVLHYVRAAVSRAM